MVAKKDYSPKARHSEVGCSNLYVIKALTVSALFLCFVFIAFVFNIIWLGMHTYEETS